MSYFDDNEDRIIYGHRRKPNRDTIRGRYNSAPAHGTTCSRAEYRHHRAAPWPVQG